MQPRRALLSLQCPRDAARKAAQPRPSPLPSWELSSSLLSAQLGEELPWEGLIPQGEGGTDPVPHGESTLGSGVDAEYGLVGSH